MHNHFSHRAEMRQGAAAVRASAGDRKPTGEDYRRMRRALALARREEQATARDQAGTSRRVCRAIKPESVRTPGRIAWLDALIGRA